MLKVERFVNQLMTSNCYLVYDDATKKCLVIDPGSEKSLNEIAFIEAHRLSLDYIILTHEHTDHNWGVNALREHFKDTKLICSEECNKHIKKANRAYFLLYYDDPVSRYEIAPADILIMKDQSMGWGHHQINYVMTPGHSYGSMCIEIDEMLFTGDTIMPYKPYFNGRDSNQDDWNKSILNIKKIYMPDLTIFPGHGESLTLEIWESSNY